MRKTERFNCWALIVDNELVGGHFKHGPSMEIYGSRAAARKRKSQLLKSLQKVASVKRAFVQVI